MQKMGKFDFSFVEMHKIHEIIEVRSRNNELFIQKMKDLKQIIKALDLNLNGSTVLTEAVSEYQFMPLLAALAGAML